MKTIAVYRFLKATPDNQDLQCEIVQQTFDGVQFLFALKDKQGLIAEATVESKDYSIEMALPQLRASEKSVDAFNLYATDKLFHGSRFQFLKELKIWESSGSAKSIIYLPFGSTGLPNKKWNFYQLVDAALQTLGAYLIETDYQRAIPLGIEKLSYQVTKAFTEELFCELTQVKIRDQEVEGKLEIFNERHELLCHLGKAKFRVIDP